MEGMVSLKYSLNNGIRVCPVEIGFEMHMFAVGFKFSREILGALPMSLICQTEFG